MANQNNAVVYCYNKKITYQKNGKDLCFNKLKAVYTHEDNTRTYYDLVICNVVKDQFEKDVQKVGGYPINLECVDYFTKKESTNGYDVIKLFVKSYDHVEHVESISKSLEDVR